MSKRTVKQFGWLKDYPDHRDYTFEPPVSFALAALPIFVDLTAKCPDVYDQGQLGSCTANAVGAAFQFDRMKQKESAPRPSRLFLYYNSRDIEGTAGYDSGAYLRDTIKSIVAQGDCPETLWPYKISKFKTKPTPACYTESLKYQAIKYERISHDVVLMKQCLANGFPFVFGITVYDNFPMTNDGKGDVPMPSGSVLGGHAMVVVGYDDVRQRFIIRNSWGTGWGKNGYGTIPYSYLSNPNLSDDFWVITAVE